MGVEGVQGQTKGGYFSYSIFEPSVNQSTAEVPCFPTPEGAVCWGVHPKYMDVHCQPNHALWFKRIFQYL